MPPCAARMGTSMSIMSKALCEYKQIQGKEDTRTMKIKQLNDTIRETKSIKRDLLGQINEINAIASGIDGRIVRIEQAIGSWGNASMKSELTSIKAAMASLQVIANKV